ncbi:aldose 1-epimerase family protein [Demequina sp. NBRC 110056]|uniref:aldose 1-epimerase family protein n=1 Tax=Demequina sp. NBRC 110056 TaxID=1570345 RepID=UPI0009FC50B9|nr:aldose 1-epimerase family protein [Demequina sp. NBRC 110056]
MSTLSGHQSTISRGEHAATIASVGAALRVYTVSGADVVVPFAEDDIAPAFHGMVLAPWPNRLRDGQYTFAGKDLQVPVSEPALGTALHGLVSWMDWNVTSHTEDTVTLALALPASPGYPFRLDLEVTYALGDEGLTITTVARNDGDEALPYGLGFHPWFSPGDAPLDACSLQLDAQSIVTVDDRLLPTGASPVSGEFDLRAARSLDGQPYDHAWVDPIHDADGRSWARLTRADGTSIAIWADSGATAWQVCTGDAVPGVLRAGVAIEPMTCIADAFRTGDDLITIAPGGEHTLAWGIQVG